MKFISYIVVMTIAILPAKIALATNQYDFEPEEYLIYSAAIDSWFAGKGNKQVLIRDHTNIYQLGLCIETELSYLRAKIPFLDDEILNDFKAKNIKTYPLKNYINQRAEYMIITQKEIDHIFDYNPHWGSYYKRYPGSGGILTLSRVGFNRQRDQALVHIANQWQRLTGAGIYIVFDKQEDGSWKTGQHKRVWHSWNRDHPGF